MSICSRVEPILLPISRLPLSAMLTASNAAIAPDGGMPTMQTVPPRRAKSTDCSIALVLPTVTNT